MGMAFFVTELSASADTVLIHIPVHILVDSGFAEVNTFSCKKDLHVAMPDNAI